MNLTADLQTTQEAPEQPVLSLPVDAIFPNPFQPRRHFESMALVDLAASIRQYGLIQPICVRLTEQGYELVAGERRLRASILAGLSTIRAIVVNISDTESALLAMVENIQRQSLNYIEEAQGFYHLMKNHGITQEDLAGRLGKNQSTIANKVRLLRLPPKVQRVLIEQDLTERHARALLLVQKNRDLEEAEALMLEIITQVVDEGLTVIKTEELVEQIQNLSGVRKKPVPKAKIKTYVRDLRIFTNTIRQAVSIMRDSGFEAAYDVEEGEEGCLITVKVKYNK